MATLSSLRFYLLRLRPVTCFTATVSADPADPYNNISFIGGASGTASAIGTSGGPNPGNTISFYNGATKLGTTRLRSISAISSGSLKIAETDTLGPLISAGNTIEVGLEWRLWPRVPRFVLNGPTSVEQYEDYDIGYFGKFTQNWLPVAVAGPPAFSLLSGGTAQAQFVGDRSYALAPGATISSYLWTAHGSVEGTSTSQGTEASPVTFTWTSAGQKLVTLRVTDSLGGIHIAYTWVFVIDPANPTGAAYTEFDAFNDSLDWSSGGGQCSFTVHGAATTSDFPPETMVVLACSGDITTPTGSWPNRTNVLFVGYVQGDSIRQDPDHNTVSFRAVTIDGLMKSVAGYPARLEDTSGPRQWTDAKDITVDRAASYLGLWRSTLYNMTPIVPLNDTAEIQIQDFGRGTLYSQLQNDLMGDAFGKVVSDHQSVLHFERDYQNMISSERTAVTTRKTLHKGIWVGVVEIDERPGWMKPVRKVKWSGVYYAGDGASPVPLFSEAPGDVQGDTGSEAGKSGFILDTQTNLNVRTGLEFARQNLQYPSVRMQFLNDGSFTIAPQERFGTNIEAADNNRGLAFTTNVFPRRIRRTYNHDGGYFTVEVEFEPAADGRAGETVNMPTNPPTDNPVSPINDEPPTPPPVWVPPTTTVPGALVAADSALGVYWSLSSGASWQRRVNGLLTTQYDFLWLLWDPWWFTAFKKGTTNPEEVILWGGGHGFVVRSDNAGKNWLDLTPNLGTPPNIFGDSPAPTATDLSYIAGHGTIHQIDTFYIVAHYETAGGDERGWALKTEDNGQTWTWVGL